MIHSPTNLAYPNCLIVSKMNEAAFQFDSHNEVQQRHGYYMFFGSAFSFCLLNCIVYRVGKPESVKSEAWKWRNLLISLIHGLICGTWDILCLVLYPEMFDDLLHHINYFTYFMVAFSTGYFVYDFVDMAYNRKLLNNWEVTVHHIAVGSNFWYNFHCKMCIGYNVLALMAEINSFFLHSRKLLQMMNVSYDNTLYRTVIYFNLVTFFFCRGYSTGKITYAMSTEYDRVPGLYFICLAASMFVMNGINPVLFWRLLRNDILRGWKHKSNADKSTHVKPIMNGNNNIQYTGNHIKSN